MLAMLMNNVDDDDIDYVDSNVMIWLCVITTMIFTSA